MVEECTPIEIGTMLNPPVDQKRDRIPKLSSGVVQFVLLILRLAVSYLSLHPVDIYFIGRAFSNGVMGTTRHAPTVDSP